ncbi:unnamed protein product [Bemisia tabaci]|uniref:Uncharacterized protein n=1 Tax=Bemisia tabaci TaxID=7038 RepID=A0A9P0ALI7_BEMTA|nr:unnamed protein product [Bemisia tabaci]
MILVPAESVERFHQPSKSHDPIEELHSELSRILSMNNITDAEKWSKYQQVLERCLRYAEQRRKPFKFALGWANLDDQNLDDQNLDEKGTSENKDDQQNAEYRPRESRSQSREHAGPSTAIPYSPDEILLTLPKTLRSKASVLLNKLGKSEMVKWSDDGRVSIENKPIAGAHITDLINDALRQRKTARDPVGYREFYAALAKLNVPQELIGNDNRWSLIRQFAVKETSPDSPYFNLLWPDTPAKKRKRSKSAFNSTSVRRKLNWESFSFK